MGIKDFAAGHLIEEFEIPPARIDLFFDVFSRIGVKWENPCEEDDLKNIEHGVYKRFWQYVNNIQGDQPQELFLLKSLRTIGVNSPIDLGGTLPTQIGALTDLEVLLFLQADIRGPLPSEIRFLTNLQDLAMTLTQLTGSLPSEIGQLSRLLLLSVNSNVSESRNYWASNLIATLPQNRFYFLISVQIPLGYHGYNTN